MFTVNHEARITGENPGRTHESEYKQKCWIHKTDTRMIHIMRKCRVCGVLFRRTIRECCDGPEMWSHYDCRKEAEANANAV